MADTKYRLITRSDFDGLVSAVLLKELNMIDDILFVHPKDMQDGKIAVTDRDITTNLPYVPGVYMCFDHHYSETKRTGEHPNQIIDPDMPSAARVVYNYFGGKEKFPHIPEDLLTAVDKADSAKFDREDILNPVGWTLLSFIMDSRTGLGYHHKFQISNYQLMIKLISLCRTKTAEEVLCDPDVRERIELYMEHYLPFINQLKRCSTVHGNLVEVNFLQETTIYAGNRFMIYALYPEAQVSMYVMWGKDKKVIVYALGKSILNPTSKTNIGDLMLKYGGGGHRAAGTCQIPVKDAEKVKAEIIATINSDA